MAPIWQNIVVFLIVAAAALYAAWRWMPAGWRRGAARQVAAETLDWPHDLTNEQVRAEREALRQALEKTGSDPLEEA